MKNPPDKPLQRRRLVLRREILPCTYFSGCHPTLTGCVE
jgi:hypothetical protein